jgi:hypothetical protein
MTLTLTDMFQGTELLAILVAACLIVWPEETQAVLVSTSLKIQVYWVNWRMKRQARKLHGQLVKLSKEAGFPDPGPFRFVNLWERDQG